MVKGGIEGNFMCLAITITAKNVSAGMKFETSASFFITHATFCSETVTSRHINELKDSMLQM
jgi:hypothetical protein